jgi:hypothetical protein
LHWTQFIEAHEKADHMGPKKIITSAWNTILGGLSSHLIDSNPETIIKIRIIRVPDMTGSLSEFGILAIQQYSDQGTTGLQV